jgi:hypothetical protein
MAHRPNFRARSCPFLTHGAPWHETAPDAQFYSKQAAFYRDIEFPTTANACKLLSYPGTTTAVSEPLGCQWVKPQRVDLSRYPHLDRRMLLWLFDI